MRGQFVPLSPVRKLILDLTALHVPSVPVQRMMNVKALADARVLARGRPAWSAIFAKAYAMVAAEMPVLRRAYVKLPSPRFYEYPLSTVSMVVEREHHGEMVALTTLIKAPESQSVEALSETIREAKTIPIEDVKSFKRMLFLARWPRFIRMSAWWLGLNIGRQRGNYFGTFGVSVYSGLGSESLHPISPLTAILNYGVIAADGTVAVRIMYDHRVLDGSMVARVLERIEQKLKVDLLAELNALKA